MQDQLINTTVIDKLQNALQKVKDAYIEQKQLNAELNKKLKEVTFGRDQLLQDNRVLQKKIDMISNQNLQKDDEIHNMIDEIDSLLDDDTVSSIDDISDTNQNIENIDSDSHKNDHSNLDIPKFEAQNHNQDQSNSSEKSSSQNIGFNQYKSIDEPIDFDNVEDLLSSLNDD